MISKANKKFSLALKAGIKEGLYDMEALAAYLLYRLNVLNPICKFLIYRYGLKRPHLCLFVNDC